MLETGDKIPADCIFLSGNDLVCDESKYNESEEPFEVQKHSIKDESVEHQDCFLLSHSLITRGTGLGLVCAVGERSRRGVIEERIGISDEKSPLQERLENLGSQMTKYAVISGLGIFAILALHAIITVSVSDSNDFHAGDFFLRLIDNFTLSITLIIVAVPEGLPLAVGIVLAFAVRQMKQDKVLIKNLDSPEVMGQVKHICSGKTATLTNNDMEVKMYYANSRIVKNSYKNMLLNCDFEEKFVDLIRDCIIYNCEARIEIDEESRYRPVGSGTECGMLKMLQDCDMDLHKLI